MTNPVPPVPSSPSASSVVAELAQRGHDPRATVYGPALFGTVRVDDPRALAELRAAHAPAMPRPAPQPAPPPPRTPPLAVAGLVLAVVAPPVGCVVSAVALARILAARPRPPGEVLAALGLALSVLVMTAALALALG